MFDKLPASLNPRSPSLNEFSASFDGDSDCVGVGDLDFTNELAAVSSPCVQKCLKRVIFSVTFRASKAIASEARSG